MCPMSFRLAPDPASPTARTSSVCKLSAPPARTRQCTARGISPCVGVPRSSRAGQTWLTSRATPVPATGDGAFLGPGWREDEAGTAASFPAWPASSQPLTYRPRRSRVHGAPAGLWTAPWVGIWPGWSHNYQVASDGCPHRLETQGAKPPREHAHHAAVVGRPTRTSLACVLHRSLRPTTSIASTRSV